MKNNIKTVLTGIIAVAILFSGCVTKVVEDKKQIIPPNVRIYHHPKKLVWMHLIQTIRNDFLIPFDYASLSRGNFATKEIRSDDLGPKTKFRLSGSITFDGSGTVVTLYRYDTFWDEQNKQWKSVPSDLSFEVNILNIVSQKLGDYKVKK